MSRKKVAGDIALDEDLGLLVLLRNVPLAKTDITSVRTIISVVAVLPVLTICVPVNGWTVVFGQDRVPEERVLVVNHDGEGE